MGRDGPPQSGSDAPRARRLWSLAPRFGGQATGRKALGVRLKRIRAAQVCEERGSWDTGTGEASTKAGRRTPMRRDPGGGEPRDTTLA